MNLSFTKLKNAGLPKASAKFASLGKAPSVKQPKIKEPRMFTTKKQSSYDFGKITKMAKLPKTKKVTILKKAIKKVKPFKFS